MFVDTSKGQNQTFLGLVKEYTLHWRPQPQCLVRRLDQSWGQAEENRLLRGSSRGMKSAYKQIGVCKDQPRFVVIVIFDPDMGCRRAAISWALPFGIAGSVLRFNSAPTFIAVVCRRFLANPVQHFSMFSESWSQPLLMGSGFKWFAKLCAVLGWKFDPEKDHSPGSRLEMLGDIEDWSNRASRHVLGSGPSLLGWTTLLALLRIARENAKYAARRRRHCVVNF